MEIELKNDWIFRYLLVLGLAILFLAIMMVLFGQQAQATDHVVISEWTSRGIGGSTDEFVELYNPTENDVDISGWEIWTYNASALFCPEWGIRVTLPGAQGSHTTVIPAKHHFLIADSCGSYTGPYPDAWFYATFGFKDDNGTIRLTTGSAGTNATVDTVAWEAYPDPLGARLWAEGGVPTTGRGYNDDWKTVERKAFASSTEATMTWGGTDYYWGNGEDTENTAADWFVRTWREPQRLSDGPEPPIQNLDTGVRYADLHAAVGAALDGERLKVWHGYWHGDLVIDGKSIEFVDSSVNLYGSVSLINGASLTFDPSWWNQTGDVWVDNGTTLTLDNTILQMNSTFHGELRIQVNDTGSFYVINNSIIRRGTAFYYDMYVEGLIQVIDSRIEDCTYIRLDGIDLASIFDNAFIGDWDQYGIWINGEDLFIVNTTFSKAGANVPMRIASMANLTALNCTFDKDSVQIDDATCSLTVQWYLHVYVHQSGIPLIADVYLYDQTPWFGMIGTTDLTGWMRWYIVTEYVENSAGRTEFTPHNIYATTGPLYGSEAALMDASKTISINAVLARVHNVEQALDYIGIQPAVMDANPGEHLEVYDGIHNETVLVGRAVTITGVAAVKPIVNGKDATHTFTITAEGVEIVGLNITNTGANYGIYATAGGFNIHDNLFYTQGYGLYVNIFHQNTGSITIGDIFFRNNEVQGLGGVHFQRIYIQNPLSGSNIQIGDLVFEQNIMHNVSSEGIALNHWATNHWECIVIENMRGGILTIGDFIATGNQLKTWGGEGIKFHGNLINLTDVTVDIGIMNISGNNLTTKGDFFDCTGVDDWGWRIGRLYGTTTINIGVTHINDNIIDCDTHGVVFFLGLGNQLYNSSSITVGEMRSEGNNITSERGGIFFYNMFSAWEMYDDSTLTLGDLIIDSNVIVSGPMEQSITVGSWIFAYDMHDDTIVNLGRVFVTNNVVNSQNIGINWGLWEVGKEMYGNSQASFGDLIVTGNEVTSIDTGIYLSYDQVGYNIYDKAGVTLGNFLVTANSVNSGNEGIYFDVANSAYEMHNDAHFSMGDVVIDSNDIDSTDIGIYHDFHDNAYYMHNNSWVIFGNFYATDNNITSQRTSIAFFIGTVWNEVGCYMYDNTWCTIGEVYITDNIIDLTSATGGYALESYPVNIGNYMYGNSYLSYGSWYVEGNNITSAADGIYTGPEYCGYYMYDNSKVVFHDYYVRANIVDATGQGISIGYYDCGESMWDYSRVTGGNMSVTGNNASGTNNYGYYLYYDYMGYDMYDDTNASFGWVETSNNNFSSVNRYAAYIEIYYLGAYMHGNSQAYIDAIIIINNEFWSTTSDGLYYYEFYENAYYMYDYSYVQIGDVIVNDNYINAGGNGIYLDTWTENAYYMYQYASADFGNFEFNRNIIETGANGMYASNVQYWANYLNWDNHVTMGHWQFNDNKINATGGTGICIFNWYDIGAYMYGTSTFTGGNLEVLRNVINAVGGEGMDVSIMDLAYYNYGSSECHFGDFLFNNNKVNASGYGIYISAIEFLAFYMYDNSYACFGNFEVNNNDIIAGYGSALGYDGIYMYFYENGYEMYGHSEAYFGHVQMNDNTIICHDDDGIFVDYFYDIGAHMYENSYFEMDNFEVCGNWIDANNYGIYLEYIYELAYYNDDNSQAHFGDFLVNENNITSGSTGIYAENYEDWGDELDDSADAYFGDVEFNNNTINASGYGIDIEYFYEWGYDLRGSNEVIFGHVQVNDNDILASGGDGIYVYYFYDIGSYMYQSSYFYMENFEICRNIINASDDGIEVYEIDELGYEMYESSAAVFGDLLFNDNDIIAGSYGFYNEYIEYLAYDVYDDSRVYFGDFQFNRNDIQSVDDGFYFDYGWYENGYDVDDNARAYFGDFQINDNEINSTGGSGIYFEYVCYLGIYMDDNGYVEFGNFEVCRNNIVADDYGIYFYEFYELGYDNYGSTQVIFGDFLFNDNVILSGWQGIEIDYMYELAYELSEAASVTFGNIEFNRNHITAGYEGMYLDEFYDWGYNLYVANTATFGHFQVNENNITAGLDTATTHEGVYMYYLDDLGGEMYVNSVFTMGNIEFCNNTVNATAEGFYLDYFDYWGTYMYGNSRAYFGDFLFNDNHIISGDDGLYIDYHEYLGYENYGTSEVHFGNFEFNRNWVDSGSEGLYTYMEYWGDYLYDSSVVTFGHFQMNDNWILSVDDGLDMDYFYEIGSYMEGKSYFSFGEFEMQRNFINSTGSEGIECDIEYLAYENYDQSRAYFGNFLFNDNVIISGGDGIYFDYWDDFASYMYNDAYAWFGNFEVNRNTITSVSDGIYHEYIYDWGYEMYDDTWAHFGYVQFNDNWIESGGYGIYIYEFDDMGSYMYGNSYVEFGNWEVINNTINSTDEGIYIGYIEYCGYYMYDNARAIFSDILINENNIIAGGDGIYIYRYYENGAYMYGNAMVTFGVFQINNNAILAGSYGIDLDDWYENGYEMYDYSFVEFGNFEILHNWIDASGYGIYIYPYDWAYYVYDHSIFVMGDWLINDNTIVSAGSDGIYFYTEDLGYHVENNARAYIGNNEIVNNTINATGDGIEAWWWYYFGAYLYDNAYVEVGDCIITDNNITVAGGSSYGIYTGPYEAGYYVYDDAQAYLGDYIIQNNVIHSNDSYGMYVYWNEIGYNLEAWSFAVSHAIVKAGDMLITDNLITAPNSYGIYLYGYYNGYYLYDYAGVTIGGLVISRNTVESFDDAIYVYLEDMGSNVNNEASASIGKLELEENDVNSTDGAGIYVFLNYYLYEVYNDATISIDEIHITGNTITARTVGIDFRVENSVALYDNCVAYFPGLRVTDNWVDPDVSAFNYNTVGTPVGMASTATLIYGDVIVSGNTFDGGLYGMLFDWQDPDPNVPQPTFYISYNDVSDGTVNSTGLFMKNIDGAYIETLTIDSYDQGIYANKSNIWYMFNSTITNAASYDLNLTSGSFIGAVNCTFDKADVFFEDNASMLKVGWFMNVLVITQSGYGVPSANVTAHDVYGTEVFGGISNDLGRAFFIVAWDYLENITGIIDSYNNYTADANKAGVFGSAIPDPVMDQTKLVIIVLGDSIPPNVFGDTSDTFGTTGDPFNFGINASDNFGIYSIHVNYRFGSAGPYTNMSLSGGGPYWLTIVIPSDFVGPMEYYFSAQDVGGNWIETGVASAPITDNDAPTINADNSDITAATGDIFTFILDAIDNINVTEAHVVWWFGAGAPTNDTMAGSGPYTSTIIVPLDSLDTLHYYFTVTDAAGNWLVGPQVDVNVTDNDAPTLNADNSDTVASTGEAFNFNADITDNIGMNETYLVYWFGSETPANVTMIGTGPYNYMINIPTDSLDTLHYYFVASDLFGNWFVGTQVDVTVIDNDAPTSLADTSDGEATTGDAFMFEVNASDNIGVSEAHVVYWFGSGPQTNATMSGTGPYTLGITVPLNSLDTLHYYVTITDEAGNWLVGPQVDIPVMDNDAPTIVSDDSDTSASDGSGFTFNLDATDNIGVFKAYVIYWLDSEPETNATMSGTGPYTRTFTIPAGSSGYLHYYFAITDAAGNWFVGTQVDVLISDREAPTLISDNSDTTATTGDSFEFNATMIDNIDIAEVHVVYWFGSGSQTNATMTGTDTYIHIITVPSNSLDTLHYYFTANDSSGNWLVCDQVDVPGVDNIPPAITQDSSDADATTGDVFTFAVTASDNIGVAEVHVVYWFGSGNKVNLTIKDGTQTITVPNESLDPLHYYFTIKDTSGNWVVGPQHDIGVEDNDAPYNLVDDSDTLATTGDAFTFTADADDNIEVTRIEVFYWLDSDSPTSVTVTGTGPYTYSIDISPNAVELHYYFVFYDAANNSLSSEQRYIVVTDNDLGSLSNDASDTSGKEDGEFNFQIDASDNVGVSQVYVVYWFGDDESKKNYVLLTSEDGTYRGSIIPRQSGTMHYYFILTDDAGNTLESSENTVSIASKPAEEEGVDWLPWVLVIILVLIILLLLFLLFARRKEEAEEITKPGELGPEEELEEEGEIGPSEEIEAEVEEEEGLEPEAEEVEFEEEPKEEEEIGPSEEIEAEVEEEEGLEPEAEEVDFEEEPKEEEGAVTSKEIEGEIEEVEPEEEYLEGESEEEEELDEEDEEDL